MKKSLSILSSQCNSYTDPEKYPLIFLPKMFDFFFKLRLPLPQKLVVDLLIFTSASNYIFSSYSYLSSSYSTSSLLFHSQTPHHYYIVKLTRGHAFHSIVRAVLSTHRVVRKQQESDRKLGDGEDGRDLSSG